MFAWVVIGGNLSGGTVGHRLSLMALAEEAVDGIPGTFLRHFQRGGIPEGVVDDEAAGEASGQFHHLEVVAVDGMRPDEVHLVEEQVAVLEPGRLELRPAEPADDLLIVFRVARDPDAAALPAGLQPQGPAGQVVVIQAELAVEVADDRRLARLDLVKVHQGRQVRDRIGEPVPEDVERSPGGPEPYPSAAIAGPREAGGEPTHVVLMDMGHEHVRHVVPVDAAGPEGLVGPRRRIHPHPALAGSQQEAAGVPHVAVARADDEDPKCVG